MLQALPGARKRDSSSKAPIFSPPPPAQKAIASQVPKQSCTPAGSTPAGAFSKELGKEALLLHRRLIDNRGHVHPGILPAVQLEARQEAALPQEIRPEADGRKTPMPKIEVWMQLHPIALHFAPAFKISPVKSLRMVRIDIKICTHRNTLPSQKAALRRLFRIVYLLRPRHFQFWTKYSMPE